MKNLIKQVSYADWHEFRQTAIKRCGWNAEKFRNRCSGRTPITEAERIVLQQIIDELNDSTKVKEVQLCQ